MTTLADEIERQIAWAIKNCLNAPYVPIKIADARAVLTALRGAEQVREKAAQCVGCDDRPAPENNPCAVCGRAIREDRT